MPSIKEKVAYLMGYAEASGLDPDKTEDHLLLAVLEIVSDLADKVEEIEEDQAAQEDETEELRENFFDLIEVLSDEFGDVEEEFYGAYDDGEEDEDELYEVVCPKCGMIYSASFEDFDDGNVVCPNCQAPFELDEKIIEKAGGNPHPEKPDEEGGHVHGPGCKHE